MPFRTIYFVLTSGAIASALFMLESRAHACSPGNCVPAVTLPAEAGARVPANLPGFTFTPAKLSYPFAADGAVVDAGLDEIELLDSTGKPVPTTRKLASANSYLLTPASPLSSGMYKLEFFSCSSTALPIEVVDSAPFPTESGELHAEHSVRVWTYSNAGRGPPCTVNAEAAVVRLEVKPSPTLEPWLSLVRWDVTVDGQPWHGRYVDSADYSGSLLRADPLTLFSVCSDAGSPLSPPDNLSLGAHHVSVRPTVVGAQQNPPVMEIDVTLTCPAVSGGEDSGKSTNGASEDGGMASTPASGSDSGCSTATADVWSPESGGALAALLLCLRTLHRKLRGHRSAA